MDSTSVEGLYSVSLSLHLLCILFTVYLVKLTVDSTDLVVLKLQGLYNKQFVMRVTTDTWVWSGHPDVSGYIKVCPESTVVKKVLG